MFQWQDDSTQNAERLAATEWRKATCFGEKCANDDTGAPGTAFRKRWRPIDVENGLHGRGDVSLPSDPPAHQYQVSRSLVCAGAARGRCCALPSFTGCLTVGMRAPTLLPTQRYNVSLWWSRFPFLLMNTLALAVATMFGDFVSSQSIVFAFAYRLVGLNQMPLGIELSGLVLKAWTGLVPSINVGRLVEPPHVGPDASDKVGSMDAGALQDFYCHLAPF